MSELNEIERARFAALSDVLIPRADGALCASEAGIDGPLLAAIQNHAPERIALLRQVTGRAEADPARLLAAVMQEDRATYDAFCETVVAAYFMSPDVRRRIGYSGREPVPARSSVENMEDLLLPVLEAGFAPRDC